MAQDIYHHIAGIGVLIAGIAVSFSWLCLKPSLSRACRKGDVDRVRKLLAKNPLPDLDKEDEYSGNTPLIDAIHSVEKRFIPATELDIQHCDEIVRMLLEKGADPNKCDNIGRCPLSCAIEHNLNTTIAQLLQAGAIPDQAEGVLTEPFLDALSMENADIVRILLDAGTDVNKEYEEGWTALMHASEHEDPEMARLMIDAGANLNHQNQEGNTALHVAVERQNHELVELLAERGCDPTIRNNKGQTAKEMALSLLSEDEEDDISY